MTAQDSEDRRTAMACLGVHPSWNFSDLHDRQQLDVQMVTIALEGARKEGYRAAVAKDHHTVAGLCRLCGVPWPCSQAKTAGFTADEPNHWGVLS